MYTVNNSKDRTRLKNANLYDVTYPKKVIEGVRKFLQQAKDGKLTPFTSVCDMLK